MIKLFAGLGAIIGAIILFVLMLLLEAAIHLAVAFFLVKGADFVASWFGADLVPDGKMTLVVGSLAFISYLLARISKVVKK
jgi:uncharacterized membrane protein